MGSNGYSRQTSLLRIHLLGGVVAVGLVLVSALLSGALDHGDATIQQSQHVSKHIPAESSLTESPSGPHDP